MAGKDKDKPSREEKKEQRKEAGKEAAKGFLRDAGKRVPGPKGGTGTGKPPKGK